MQMKHKFQKQSVNSTMESNKHARVLEYSEEEEAGFGRGVSSKMQRLFDNREDTGPHRGGRGAGMHIEHGNGDYDYEVHMHGGGGGSELRRWDRSRSPRRSSRPH